MYESFKEFLSSFGKWWWVVLVNYVGVVAGTFIDLTDKPWAVGIWVLSLLFAVILAPLFAFHSLRKKRDELQLTIDDLKQGRPQFTIGKQAGLEIKPNEATSELLLLLRLYYRNTGQKPAYNWHMRVGYAPDGHPKLFAFIPPEMSSANRIDNNTDIEYGSDFPSAVKYEVKDGKKQIQFEGALVFCALEYTDSEIGGNEYREEMWYTYKFDIGRMGNLSIPRMKQLEPYVRLAYQQEKSSE